MSPQSRDDTIHVQILMFYVIYTEICLRGYIHERGLLMPAPLIKGETKQAKLSYGKKKIIM